MTTVKLRYISNYQGLKQKILNIRGWVLGRHCHTAHNYDQLRPKVIVDIR